MCETLFYLKNLRKIYLPWNISYLYLGSSLKTTIIRAKIWFSYGQRWLANNMTGQADVGLCKLGGGWRLVNWMYQALFFPSRAKEAKK